MKDASKSLFAPPSVDLSSSGIKKFKEPEFEGYGVKGSQLTLLHGKELASPGIKYFTCAKDSEVCKITRADGTSSFHGDFQAVKKTDNKNLFQLYSLVQERYKHRSIEGHDLDL
ncbi:hypothetical protein Tco_1369846 [Tanacetum coccineum]